MIREDVLFKNKYRIKSMRLLNYNYASTGYYFITICVRNHELLFGNIIDNKMALFDAGKIIKKFWLEIPQHFDNVELDEFIIMPNHIHGIIIIINNCNRRDEAMPRLYTRNNTPADTPANGKSAYAGKYPQMSIISPPPKSLPVIIGSFKSISTKTINQKIPNMNFAWQTRYYEHIIRDEKSLNKIRQYIINNPVKWQTDRNNM